MQILLPPVTELPRFTYDPCDDDCVFDDLEFPGYRPGPLASASLVTLPMIAIALLILSVPLPARPIAMR